MSRGDAVKAGKYELLANRWDEQTSKPGEPFAYIRHVQGDVIDLNAEDAARLLSAAAVGEPGARQRAAAAQAKALYEAALALIPEGLRGDLDPPEPEPSTPPSGNGDVRPSPGVTVPTGRAAKAATTAAGGAQIVGDPAAGTGSGRR